MKQKQKRESGPVDVVYCEWIDSETQRGWNHKSNIENTVCKIRSLGILVTESKTHITLSTSHSRNNNFVDSLTIPKVAVTYLRYLKI